MSTGDDPCGFEYDGVEYDTYEEVEEAMIEAETSTRATRAELTVVPDVDDDANDWTDPDPEEDDRPASAGLLDLTALRAEPLQPREWLETGLFELHAVNKLTAASGTGKSLLLVDMAVNWSLGQSALDLDDNGHRRTLGNGEPLRVLYVDGELGPRWWHSYLDKLAAPLDLPNFRVVTLTDDAPVWDALCTPVGAAQFTRWVERLADELGGIDVVILDTLSAFVGGEENSNDTWADFDRLVTLPLKRRGYTIVYSDHTGHKAERARGGSAKKAKLDVEVVASVVDPDIDPNLLELTTDPRRGKMRNGHDGHPMTVYVRRTDGPLGHIRHTPEAKEVPGKRIADEIRNVLSQYPEGGPDGLTGTEIEKHDDITGKAETIRGTLAGMVRAGQVVTTKVARPIEGGRKRQTTVHQLRQIKITVKAKRESAESEKDQ